MNRLKCTKCLSPFNKMVRIYTTVISISKNNKKYTNHIPVGWLCINCKGVVLDK